MDFDIEISNSWTQAAADLEIRVVAPFTLTTTNGEPILFEAPILDFGGPKGLIVGNQESEFGGRERRAATTIPTFILDIAATIASFS
jgi:hypothetical protein